jgi:protein involved in polysaccharide export with SLBB domain
MKTLFWTGTVFACVLLTGCGGSGTYTSPTYAPSKVPPSASAFLRVGDKITIQLTGVPDGGFLVEKQIPASGQIMLNYLDQPFQAAGLSPADLAEQITAAYKTQKIYKSPVVTVIPEVQYIDVGGEVRGPSNVPYRPDATVMSTINTCGGFTEFANRRSVRIIRGGQVIYVNCNKAMTDPGADPPVYPGDQIVVPRTIL